MKSQAGQKSSQVIVNSSNGSFVANTTAVNHRFVSVRLNEAESIQDLSQIRFVFQTAATSFYNGTAQVVSRAGNVLLAEFGKPLDDRLLASWPT